MSIGAHNSQMHKIILHATHKKYFLNKNETQETLKSLLTKEFRSSYIQLIN